MIGTWLHVPPRHPSVGTKTAVEVRYRQVSAHELHLRLHLVLFWVDIEEVGEHATGPSCMRNIISSGNPGDLGRCDADIR